MRCKEVGLSAESHKLGLPLEGSRGFESHHRYCDMEQYGASKYKMCKLVPSFGERSEVRFLLSLQSKKYRGVEKWHLIGLITQGSRVQVPLPLQRKNIVGWQQW